VDRIDDFCIDLLLIYRSRQSDDQPDLTGRVMGHCGVCKAFWKESHTETGAETHAEAREETRAETRGVSKEEQEWWVFT
jgi:hypothetical protein